MRAYDLEVTGSLKVQGDIKAENYIVETTVTSMTQSFASGSSKFGDGVLDSHQFTGSLLVTGSNLTIDSAGTVSGSSTSTGSFGRVESSTSNVSDNAFIGNRLGIGLATSPDQPLHIKVNNSNSDPHFFIENTNASGRSHARFWNSSRNSYVSFGQDNDNSFKISSTVHFGSSVNMIITTGGDVEFPRASTISGSATSTGSFGHVKIPNGNIDIMTGNANTRVGIGKLNTNMFYIGANPSGSAGSGGNVGVKVGTVDSGGNVRKHWTFTSAGNFESQAQNLGGITMGGTTFKMDSTYNDVKIQMGYDTVPFVLNKPIYNLADVEFIQDEKKNIKFFEDAQTGGEIMQLYRGGINVSGSGNISGSSTSTGSFGELEIGHIFPHSDGVSNIGGVGKQFADLYLKDNGNLRFGNANVYLNGTTDTLNLTGGNLVIAANFGLGLSGTAKVYHSNYADFWYRSLFDSGHGGMAGFSSYVNVNSVYGAANRGWEFHDDNANVTRVGIDSLTGLIKTQGGVSGSSSSTGSFGTLRVGTNVGSLSSGLAFGDGNTGFFENSDNILYVTTNGSNRWQFNGGSIMSLQSGGPALYGETASSTNPTLIPHIDDGDTGIGRASADNLSLIAGGAEILRLASNTISGSASSTGSFGRMEIHSAYGPTAVISVQDGYHAGGLRLQGSTRVASPGSYIELNGGNYAYGSAVFNYGYNQTNSELSFQVDGTERIHFGGLGKITATSIETIGLASAGGDISGSASSTGSFGVLKLDKYNGGIGASTNTLYGVNSGGSITTGGHNSALGDSTLGAITTGDYNVALGSLALQTHTTGDRNVAIGYAAMNNTDAGSTSLDSSDNVFIGYGAGSGAWTNTSCQYNVGIGSLVMDSALDGALSNTAIGYSALSSITSGDYNTALGSNAGLSLTSGFSNVTIGYLAGDAMTDTDNTVLIGVNAGTAINSADADGSVGVGRDALQDLTSGQNSTAVGYRALADLTTGDRNTAVGYGALDAITTGNDNVAVGWGAGGSTSNTTGTNNTFLGGSAGNQSFNKNDNTFVGYRAGRENRAGANSVIIGSHAGYSPQGAQYSGSNNVFAGYGAGAVTGGDNNALLGAYAGYYSTGSENTFVGSGAGLGGTSSAPYSSGQYNAAVGRQALKNFTTGNYNTAIGYQAALNNTSGGGNVAIGSEAGETLTTTSNTVLMGYQAGYAINSTSANGTVAIGYQAGTRHTSGAGCVYVGNAAGDHCTDGNRNVAIGEASLSGNADDDNVAVGYGALGVCLSADNVGVGTNAGNTISTGAENTLVGYNVDVASGDNTNNVVLGNNLTATDKDNAVFIGNDTNHIENDFNADATWNYSSDVRQKTDIEDDTLGLDFINKIRPVVYKHKSPSEFPKEWSSYDADDKEPMGGDKRIHGLIAQEVKQALDEVGTDSFGGWSEGDDGRQRVSREMFVTPLIKAVQELSKKVEELEAKISGSI